MCDASNSSFFRNRNGTLASSARFSRVAAATLSGRLQTRFCLWPRACFPSHRPLLAGFHIGNTQPKRFLAHLFRHAEQTGAVRLRSRGGPDRGLSTDTATTETGTTPTACPLPDTGQRTGGRACTGQRPPPSTHRRAAVLFSWAEFMAEEPVKSKVRSRVPVRVGADCGTGAGDRAGRRGALDRNTQGEVVATSAMASPCTAMCAGFFAFQPARFMCAALFCCPFSGGALIPLLRSPSPASDGPSGEAAGMEANKRRLTLDLASTLQRWAEGLAVKGVSMLRSGQTAVDREADEGRG